MRVGVIGLGRMGSTHARLLSRSDDVDELLLCDLNADRARALAQELSGHALDEPDQLLARADAVVIATATPSHAELVERAVNAEVPALCEKPLAPDLATTTRLEGLVEHREAKVQVGFHRRFDPSIAAGRELVASGELGRLYVMRTNSYDAEPPPERFIPSSGGLYADVLIHDIDLIRFLSGHEIDEVYATGSVLVAEYFALHGDIDVGTVTMRLSSGALAVATATRHNALGYDSRVELSGSLDSVTLGSGSRLPLRRVEDPAPPEAPFTDFIDRFLPAYERELAAFLAFTRGERDNPCPARDAVAAQRVVLACDRSRAEGRPVRLEESS